MRLRSIPFLLLVACGGMALTSGDFGATPGGVKDMRYARELIASGVVPPPEALLVEGMFAEHDLGLSGASCTEPLCLRAAGGVAPDRAGEPRGWLQVGMSSNIDPATWQRPATTFLYTVDVSGSMGWGYAGDRPTPGELSRDLLHRLTDELTPDDEVALVTYGSSVAVPLPVQSGAELGPVHAAIDALGTDGSTNMEAGMRRAYELGRAAVARGRRNVRIVLFTDVQPNVGATGGSEFEAMVAAGATDGVHLTVLALGVGIGPAVLERMSHLRGANAFTLFDDDDVGQFFADEYPWFTTPIAFDLEVGVAPATGLAIDDAFGFPGDFADEPRLAVSTVFLSRRKGALLVSLRPEVSGALDRLAADLTLSFTTAAGGPRSTTLRVDRAGAALDGRGQWFGQEAVARSTALALLVTGMREAAERYAADPAAAEAIMQTAHDRFAADAAAIADPTLEPEVELAAALLQLIVDRAPQGTLYGY
jgi:Ca-activated chloride channel homolog